MGEVVAFFQKLFDASGWTSHWQSGGWSDFLGWLYIISDLLIWSAYFAIPLSILKYLSRRSDAKFVRAYFLFAIFILACGFTHLLDAVTFWLPVYRFNTLVRFFTGVVSWITVFHIIKILPAATSLRSHTELEKEIAERKKVEEELKLANQQLNAAQEIARLGHWQWDVPTNKIIWSKELYKIFDTEPGCDISYESYLEKLHPQDRDFVNNTIQKAFDERQFPSFTHRILLNNGIEKILQARGEILTDETGAVVKMIGTAQDITEAQIAQQQLVERTHALETSNAELQRFAYVASHDLQEPLRKIMTFTSLIEKEMNGAITEKGTVYMQKIMQSSGRMQQLIDDILTFSSLRTTKDAFGPTDLNVVFSQVLSDIEVSIESTGAIITATPMPVIEAIPTQIGQLFQNLISNALKFRREGVPPVVSLSSDIVGIEDVPNYNLLDENTMALRGQTYNWSREQFARIVIQDNGIGFEESYAEKIFEIFQRLHSSKTFEGTGIGLAICKKIVDNHHGVISATSKRNEGASFVIFLPVSQKTYL